MDCEKFDQIIIDAVYDELDELTLAAAKRHADGCTRCHSALSGLRATRKIGILPLVEAPAGLEMRVLKAAREAHRNLPWPRRVGRAISWAGSYAMKPQMAMAALLMLMLGASITILRGKPDRSGAVSPISVTERGVPEQQAGEEPRTERRSADDRGPGSPPAGGRLAKRDDERGGAPAPPAAAAPFATAPPERLAEGEGRGFKGGDKSESAADMPRPKSAPVAQAAPAAPAAQAGPDDLALNAQPQRSAASGAEKKRIDLQSGSAGLGAAAGQGVASSPPQDALASAMNLYNGGRFAEAERAFDDIESAHTKDAPRAALMAAKSSEGAFGCGKAAPKYEATWAKYSTSSPGAEALSLAADCYTKIANYPKARDLLMQLRTVAGYREGAERRLGDLNILQQQQVAARARAAAPPPAKPAAPKATTDVAQ
jgi:hypothetical protein